jgi:hypothetical protein
MIREAPALLAKQYTAQGLDMLYSHAVGRQVDQRRGWHSGMLIRMEIQGFQAPY